MTPLAFSLIFFLLSSFSNNSFRVFPLAIIFFLFTGIVIKDCRSFVLKSWQLNLIIVPILALSFLLLIDGFSTRVGQISFLKKNYTESEKIFTFTSNRPDYFINPKGLYYLSALSLENIKSEEALLYLNKLKSLNPYDADINFQIAQIHYMKKEDDEAEKLLLSSINKNPYLHPKYYYALYQVYLDKNQEEKGRELLSKTKEIYPNSSEKYNNGLNILGNNGYLLILDEIAKVLDK